MVSIYLGHLKDRADRLASFLEDKLKVKAQAKDDVVLFEEEDKASIRPSQVKAYIKRFLHSEGLRERYKVRKEKDEFIIVELPLEA